jgi:hypothetical protein
MFFLSCTLQLGKAVKNVICIREVQGSNLGLDTDSPDWSFCSIFIIIFLFFCRFTSYQKKVGDYLSPEFIVKILGGYTGKETDTKTEKWSHKLLFIFWNKDSSLKIIQKQTPWLLVPQENYTDRATVAWRRS